MEITATGRRTAGEVARPHWRNDPERPKRRYVGNVVAGPAPGPFATEASLTARIEADQAALRHARAQWLTIEQQRYRLPRRGRLLEEMVA